MASGDGGLVEGGAREEREVGENFHKASKRTGKLCKVLFYH